MDRLINYHVIDHQNVGDFFSSPLHYFDFPGYVCEAKDIRFFDANSSQYSNIIIGGGGLIYEPFRPKLKAILNSRQHVKVIFWGVGQQRYGTYSELQDSLSFDYKPFVSGANLIGVRDNNVSYNWVPCVSCMHSSFDKNRPVKHEVVIFSHKKFQIEIPGIPRMTNQNNDFEKTLDFLGSGETILTSSFHAAYWGVLLGRKVITFPFSSKFMTLRHPPKAYQVSAWKPKKWQLLLFDKVIYERRQDNIFACHIDGWKSLLKEANSFPESLEECRSRNRWFYQEVMGILNSERKSPPEQDSNHVK